MQNKKTALLPKIDYVTVLIVLFFLGLTFVVFLYYKHRIKEIQGQLKHSKIYHQSDIKNHFSC